MPRVFLITDRKKGAPRCSPIAHRAIFRASIVYAVPSLPRRCVSSARCLRVRTAARKSDPSSIPGAHLFCTRARAIHRLAFPCAPLPIGACGRGDREISSRPCGERKRPLTSAAGPCSDRAVKAKTSDSALRGNGSSQKIRKKFASQHLTRSARNGRSRIAFRRRARPLSSLVVVPSHRAQSHSNVLDSFCARNRSLDTARIACLALPGPDARHLSPPTSRRSRVRPIFESNASNSIGVCLVE